MLRLVFLRMPLGNSLSFGLICTATSGISVISVDVVENAVKIQ